MGLGAGSSLGRLIRELPNGDLIAKFLGILVFAATVLYVLFLVRQHKRQVAKEVNAGSIQSMTLSNEAGVLHLVPAGGSPPASIQSRLRSFASAEDAYHYVYQKYDEPLFRRLIIHLPGSEIPVEYIRDAGEDHEVSLRRLQGVFVENASPTASTIQSPQIED